IVVKRSFFQTYLLVKIMNVSNNYIKSIYDLDIRMEINNHYQGVIYRLPSMPHKGNFVRWFFSEMMTE
ncbi:hypothetical protein, partial [Peribacillus cavernae]|uniref:hypothetical protein n=1 Tax=Peribacillus cavernae TaxID=1674310 RepID=UPI001C8DB9D5